MLCTGAPNVTGAPNATGASNVTGAPNVTGGPNVTGAPNVTPVHGFRFVACLTHSGADPGLLECGTGIRAKCYARRYILCEALNEHSP